MAAQVSLEQMLAARTLWHAGRQAKAAPDGEPTGFAALDALLPQRGWPRRALTELLLPADGVGELALLLPTLARLTRAGATVAVVAPPYLAYAPAWQAAGVELAQLQLIDAAPRDALWAFEQCLRSGACEAVLGWPAGADAQALRRLQVAADSGDCLGFALRDRRHAANPSPAALRLEAVRESAHGIAWRVRKCRGAPVPANAFALASEPAIAPSTSTPDGAQLTPSPACGGGAGWGASSPDVTRTPPLPPASIPAFPRHRGKEQVAPLPIAPIPALGKVQVGPIPIHAPADSPSPACGGGLGWGSSNLEVNRTQPLPPAPIPAFPRQRGKEQAGSIPALGKQRATFPVQQTLHLVQGPAPVARS
ncbi:translesion DNA synthesis-associated protein ImuA [Luteimonas viscosa]|uniref:Translesion DNA synthesis-associated protein ImuA n=1 Tax=Luteimonas viscosa TaxID=1132694 RepID=A0A5D4XNZ0_9GAMM|nr:translesion DNA synthesis-associated protein ImuA [Luteimonas viscosa]